MNMYSLLYKSFSNDKVKNAKEKLKNGELSIEDVLKEPELVNSFKVTSSCQLQDILTKENMMQMIHFSISYPEYDDYNLAYKFPFNSCEILSSDNVKVLDKFFELTKKQVYESLVEDDDEIKIDSYYFNESAAGPQKSQKLNLSNLDESLNEVNKLFEKLITKNESEKNDLLEDNEKMPLANTDKKENLIRDDRPPEIPEDSQQDKINSALASTNQENQFDKVHKEQDAKDPATVAIIEQEEDPQMEKKTPNIQKISSKSQTRSKNNNSSHHLVIPDEVEDELVKYPLLDYYFSFVKQEGELDHVLCGYFAKIFSSLFQSKSVNTVKYLFERSNIIISMVRHFNRISIIECLIKLIKYDTDSIIISGKSCDEVKEEVFKEIFDFIENRIFSADEQDEETLHSITEFFLECLEDKRTLIFFIKCPKFSLKLFETFLHSIFASKLYVITRYLEKVYAELTYKEIKQAPEPTKAASKFSFKIDQITNANSKEEDVSLECYYFLELFSSMIDYLFQRFKDENFGLPQAQEDREFMNNANDKQRKLGLPKLYIMKLTLQILKHSFYVYEKKFFHYEEDFFIDFYTKIINSEFFTFAGKYFFEFPLNNSYQIVFLDIIKEILKYAIHCKLLLEHVFYEIGFLDEMIICVIEEKYCCLSKFQFSNSEIEIQSGFLPFILEIFYSVESSADTCETLRLIIDKSKFYINNCAANKFHFFYKHFVCPAILMFNRGLLHEKTEEKASIIAGLVETKMFEKVKSKVSIEVNYNLAKFF